MQRGYPVARLTIFQIWIVGDPLDEFDDLIAKSSAGDALEGPL